MHVCGNITCDKFSTWSEPTCSIQNSNRKLPWKAFKRCKMIKGLEHKPHNEELK